MPIAQRRPDFHTTIVEKLNEKTNTRKYVTHEEIQPARPERSRSALGRNASGERSAEGCYEVNAATNAATSFSPLRVCLSSAQAQQMLCEDDPSRKNKMTAFSTLLVDGASATREI